jgi:hypothetical protein
VFTIKVVGPDGSLRMVVEVHPYMTVLEGCNGTMNEDEKSILLSFASRVRAHGCKAGMMFTTTAAYGIGDGIEVVFGVRWSFAVPLAFTPGLIRAAKIYGGLGKGAELARQVVEWLRRFAVIGPGVVGHTNACLILHLRLMHDLVVGARLTAEKKVLNLPQEEKK